jgi:hypothetical protein
LSFWRIASEGQSPDPAPNVGPGIMGIRECRIAPAG